jgi:hypothetical protein
MRPKGFQPDPSIVMHFGRKSKIMAINRPVRFSMVNFIRIGNRFSISACGGSNGMAIRGYPFSPAMDEIKKFPLTPWCQHDSIMSWKIQECKDFHGNRQANNSFEVSR